MFTRRLILCVIVLLMVFVQPLSAAVTFVAAGTVASDIAAITPALPSGIATGDILLLFLETTNQAISIANQNGGTWTEVTGSPQGTGTAGSGANAVRLTVFWSRYNGTQGDPTTSDSGNHQLGRIIAFRGAVASGNPWNVTAGSVDTTADTTGDIPGETTTVVNTLIVAAIATPLPDADGTANFSAWANSDLTNVIELTDNTTSQGNGGGIGIATGDKATAGAYGTTTVTLGASAKHGMMSIALKPEVMYWSGNFSTIALASIANRTDTPSGSAQITLYTTDNAEISADNTAAARLTKAGGANLYTEYKLEFDGNGASATGGSTVDFTSYNLFLNSHAAVTHISSDDAVNVTLSVRASNYTGQLADAGDYSATQTLTVIWVGP
jgi:hypothetical protein